MRAIKMAMMIKNSYELNGSMIKIAGRQMKWLNVCGYSDDDSMENTSSTGPMQ
jgi:hypothetical protein